MWGDGGVARRVDGLDAGTDLLPSIPPARPPARLPARPACVVYLNNVTDPMETTVFAPRCDEGGSDT